MKKIHTTLFLCTIIAGSSLQANNKIQNSENNILNKEDTFALHKEEEFIPENREATSDKNQLMEDQEGAITANNAYYSDSKLSSEYSFNASNQNTNGGVGDVTKKHQNNHTNAANQDVSEATYYSQEAATEQTISNSDVTAAKQELLSYEKAKPHAMADHIESNGAIDLENLEKNDIRAIKNGQKLTSIASDNGENIVSKENNFSENENNKYEENAITRNNNLYFAINGYETGPTIPKTLWRETGTKEHFDRYASQYAEDAVNIEKNTIKKENEKMHSDLKKFKTKKRKDKKNEYINKKKGDNNPSDQKPIVEKSDIKKTKKKVKKDMNQAKTKSKNIAKSDYNNYQNSMFYID